MNFHQRSVLGAAVVIAASVSTLPALADHHHDWERNRINEQMSWEQQRAVYAHNWRHMRAEHQRELDAEMRAQWLAYHHNTWNGGYGWNTYNDPGFLNYLHGSNPGLLTRISSHLGL